MLTLPKTTHVNLLVEESVLYLTLNRPEARNALNGEMVSEMSAAFESLTGTEIRAIVMRGAGGNFCSGGDIKDMAALFEHSLNNDINAIVAYNAAAGKLFGKINTAPLAVIAILEGAVMGGGLGLACAADITIAAESARFGLPETSLGLLPAQVAPFIRRRVGESNARLLAVSGGQFDAHQAHKLGLVNYLVESEEELSKQLADVLTRIKACAPQALAGAKKLMFEPVSSVTDEPDRLGLIFAKAMTGEEAKEGTRSFIEKRKPSWSR